MNDMRFKQVLKKSIYISKFFKNFFGFGVGAVVVLQ